MTTEVKKETKKAPKVPSARLPVRYYGEMQVDERGRKIKHDSVECEPGTHAVVTFVKRPLDTRLPDSRELPEGTEIRVTNACQNGGILRVTVARGDSVGGLTFCDIRGSLESRLFTNIKHGWIIG